MFEVIVLVHGKYSTSVYKILNSFLSINYLFRLLAQCNLMTPSIMWIYTVSMGNPWVILHVVVTFSIWNDKSTNYWSQSVICMRRMNASKLVILNCACVHVCMCVCWCVCVHVCMCLCEYVCMCLCVYVCMCVYMYVCMCVSECVCVCVYLRMCM